jgi:hypothetical protein
VSAQPGTELRYRTSNFPRRFGQGSAVNGVGVSLGANPEIRFRHMRAPPYRASAARFAADAPVGIWEKWRSDRLGSRGGPEKISRHLSPEHLRQIAEKRNAVRARLRRNGRAKIFLVAPASLFRLWQIHRMGRRACFDPSPGRSSYRLFLLWRRNAARPVPGLGPGPWQKPEARLAPREVNAHIQQGIGTSAWARKFHDRDDSVGLASHEGHRPSRHMVRGDIDAQNEVARANSIAHDFHPPH